MKYLRKIITALFIIGFSCSAHADYHPPKLFSYISSNIEIGIKREGKIDTVITHDRSYVAQKSDTVKSSISESLVNDIKNEKKKETNPNKYKSRPKASGLFGGIARAFGGDYSGLIDWGGKFVDHMMEPSYLWNVSQVYTTEKKHTQTKIHSHAVSSESKDEFIKKITESYSQDINKGFIKFSVNVENLGNRSARIEKPVFVVNFVKADGSRYFVEQVVGETPKQTFVSIPPGGQHTFTILIKNRDISTLVSQYYSSDGIETVMQNALMSYNDEVRTISEVVEKKLEDSIRLEFYNGESRLIKFVNLNGKKPTLNEFIDEEIGNSFVIYDDNLTVDSPIDDYFVAVKGMKNRYAEEKLDKIDGQKLIDWRKWFVAVSDDNGDFLPFKVGDKLRPGYSLLLGYYSARDLLGESYHPTIYSRSQVKITENEPLHIDIDLQPGDQIEIDNVKVDKIYGSKVTYRIANVKNVDPKEITIPSRTIPDNYEHMASMPMPGVGGGGAWQMFPSQPKFSALLEPVRIEPVSLSPVDFAFLRNSAMPQGRWMQENDTEAQLQGMFFPKYLVHAFFNLMLTGEMKDESKKILKSAMPLIPGTSYSISLNTPVDMSFLKEFVDTHEFEKHLGQLTKRTIMVDQFVDRNENVWRLPIVPLEFPSLTLLSSANATPFVVNREITVTSLSIGTLAIYGNFQIGVGGTKLLGGPMGMPMMGVPMMGITASCHPGNALATSRLKGFESAFPGTFYNSCFPGGPSVKQQHPLFEMTVDVKVIRKGYGIP